MKLRLILLCMALAGCAETVTTSMVPSDPAAPPPPPFVPRNPEVSDSTDPCFAGSYLGLLGRDVNAIGLAESESFRIIRPGAEVTTDEVPTRVNAVVGAGGMITQVYCG